MKTGKLSELMLGRSVLKRIKNKSPYVSQGAAIGHDASSLTGEGTLITAVAASSSLDFLGELSEKGEEPVKAMQLNAAVTAVRAANSVAAEGGVPCAFLNVMILPKSMKEPWIRSVTDALEEVAATLGMQIAGGHCEVSAYVKKPVFTVTAYGYRTQKPETADKKKLLRQDIVMTKEMAQEGTGLIALLKREQLLERFSSHYIDHAAASIRRISVAAEAAVGMENRVCAMHDLSETGVFGGLWELGEKLGCGMEVSLKKIPVRQETIELTEYFGMNPYEMPAAGSMLMIAENGELLVDKLKEAGIAAAVIGRLTENNDRVILSHEEQRFLNQPR